MPTGHSMPCPWAVGAAPSRTVEVVPSRPVNAGLSERCLRDRRLDEQNGHGQIESVDTPIIQETPSVVLLKMIDAAEAALGTNPKQVEQQCRTEPCM